MSVRVELSRTIPVPGLPALEAMVAILNGIARHEAPYERVALSLGFDRILPAATGDVAVPVSVGVRTQSQRYECDLDIAASSGDTFFPRFTGSLSISPMRDAGSELWLQGAYTVPLGRIGEIVDTTLLRRAAETSLKRFVAWMAAEIVTRADRSLPSHVHSPT